jgi:uncharacterized protein (TIGR03067 family)
MLPIALKRGLAALLVLGVIILGGGRRTHRTAVAQPATAEQGPAKPLDHEKPKTDRQKVQGTWRMICAHIKGRQLSAEEIAHHTLVMRDDTYSLFKAEDRLNDHGVFRLDPTKKRKTIDITEDEGPNKGQTNRGIYLLEDDLLIVCYNHLGMGRPTAFTSKPNSSIFLFIYKRDNP